jgi:hypothetical protein
MVLELAALLGAEEHEHREERLSYRNGWRVLIAKIHCGSVDLLFSGVP